MIMHADILAILAPYLRRWNILRLATIGFANDYIYTMRHITQFLAEDNSMIFDHNYYTFRDDILIIAPQLIFLSDEEYYKEYIHYICYNIILYRNGSYIRIQLDNSIIHEIYYLYIVDYNNYLFKNIMREIHLYCNIDRYIYKYLGGYGNIISMYNRQSAIMYYSPHNHAYYCKNNYYIATINGELAEKYYIADTIRYFNRMICDIKYNRITGKIIYYIAHTPRI